MTRRRTLSDLAFPDDVAKANLPIQWASSVSDQILEWMWSSFDKLKARQLARVNFRQQIDQLERNLTLLHFVDLQAVFAAKTDGFCSFVPVHECDEFESLTAAKAKPPAYDFGFVHIVHRRWIWPIEAKVLPTPDTLSEYVGEVRDKFEAGIAAPLVGEGAMIAYLLSGDPVDFFTGLQANITVTLTAYPNFAKRPHRTSQHWRRAGPALRLHHMVMSCT